MAGGGAGQSSHGAIWWFFAVSAAPGAAALRAELLTQCFSPWRNSLPSSGKRLLSMTVSRWLPTLIFFTVALKGPQDLSWGFHPSPPISRQTPQAPGPPSPSALPGALCIPFSLLRLPFSSIFSSWASSLCSYISSELSSERSSLTPLSKAVLAPSHSPSKILCLFNS